MSSVLDHLESQLEPPASYMVNRVIDVLGPTEDLVVRQIPPGPTTP